MKARLPITILCIIAFIAFEIHAVLPRVSGVFGWTFINVIGWLALWLFADAHIEIAELSDFTEGDTWVK